ncbi:protein LAZ1 homolog 1-like isoform X2 [Salvia hispanica]|uniref:protein LAZ1 homolog 1-like isoform X2 n=1 Tax=Salvia hispanica TaxID=49212 RepID=UPI002009B73D|nr:protein LAZ1 homolog 1-like isoform X2 [Salvia hispanica]
MVFTAGTSVAVTLILSLFLIISHLATFTRPKEQKFLIAVILIVPVFALQTFISMLEKDATFYCEAVHICYPPFVAFCFFNYLVSCLGGYTSTMAYFRVQTPSSELNLVERRGCVVQQHEIPWKWFCSEWRLDDQFYGKVNIGIRNLMILQILSTLLAHFLQTMDLYVADIFNFSTPYPFLRLGQAFITYLAFYHLRLFYEVTLQQLQHVRPMFLILNTIRWQLHLGLFSMRFQPRLTDVD